MLTSTFSHLNLVYREFNFKARKSGASYEDELTPFALFLVTEAETTTSMFFLLLFFAILVLILGVP